MKIRDHSRKGATPARAGMVLLATALAGAGMGGSVAGATVSGQCGTIASIAAPASLVPGEKQDDAKMLLVTEARQKTLAADLPVDFSQPGLYNTPGQLLPPPPPIAAGTVVSSFLVHSDPIGEPNPGQRLSAIVNFTSDILGVMVQDATISGADLPVGATGVTYPKGGAANGRGLEMNVDWVRLSARSIQVSVRTGLVDDEIRVITAGDANPDIATTGYRMVGADGAIFPFGNATNSGSMVGTKLNRPIVGMASPCGGSGYWMVASDGGIFAFGNATNYGSMGGTKLNQPIVGMTATATGNGYWMVASDGGIFAFGDANAGKPFFGSMGGTKLNKPIVGMAATPTGNGYWMVASDGGIFSFGDAKFQGSTGAIHLNQPIVGMAATPTGNGYWMVASDGGIFSFGDAKFQGSTGAIHLNRPIVGMVVSPSGEGYRLVASDGGVFAYGDAPALGSMGSTTLNSPIVAAL